MLFLNLLFFAAMCLVLLKVDTPTWAFWVTASCVWAIQFNTAIATRLAKPLTENQKDELIKSQANTIGIKDKLIRNLEETIKIKDEIIAVLKKFVDSF